MKRAVHVLAAAVAVVVIAAGLFFTAFAIDDWREEIAAEASAALGRTVTLDGPLALDLGRKTTVRARHIRIANSAGGVAPALARLAYLELRFDLLAALGGDFTVRQVVLKDLDLALEEGKDGGNNWLLGVGAASTEPPPMPGFVIVENARIVYRSKELALDLVVEKLEAETERGVVRAAVKASRLALRPLGKPKPTAPSAKLFPATPLPLDALAGLAVEATVELGALETPSAVFRDFAATISLKDGRLDVAPLSFDLGGGKIAGALMFGPDGESATASFDLRGNGIEIGRLAQEAGAGQLVVAEGSIDLRLTSRGRSAAEMAASLAGESKLFVGNGRIKAQALDLAVGGLTTVLGSLFEKDSEWSALNCAVSRVVFDKGVGTHKLLLVDTGASTVTGEGKIDLAKDRIEMKLTPRAKSPTLNVAVPIRISGSLGRPTVRPDALGAVARLGRLLGAVVFPPAAILAFADFGNGEAASCLKGFSGR